MLETCKVKRFPLLRQLRWVFVGTKPRVCPRGGCHSGPAPSAPAPHRGKDPIPPVRPPPQARCQHSDHGRQCRGPARPRTPPRVSRSRRNTCPPHLPGKGWVVLLARGFCSGVFCPTDRTRCAHPMHPVLLPLDKPVLLSAELGRKTNKQTKNKPKILKYKNINGWLGVKWYALNRWDRGNCFVPKQIFKHHSDKTKSGLPCRWAGCLISASHVPLKRHFYKFTVR